MAKCKWCGKSFQKDEAEEYFEHQTFLNYGNLKMKLCGECAVHMIEGQVDGAYFEKCGKCGETFDLIEDEYRFGNHFPWYNRERLRDYWDSKPLCADCAFEAYEEYYGVNNNAEDEDEDDEDGGLSVHNAALIWASHGKDEDYMFGYTEDELEDAL
jgi:hypothetical protein